MGVCGSCGSVVPSDSTVCGYCGTAVVDPSATSTLPPPPPPPGGAPHVATGAPPLPPLDATGELAITPVPNLPPEGRGRRGVVVGIAALVAAAAAGGVVLYMMGQDDDSEAGTDTTPDSEPAETSPPNTTPDTTPAPETSPAPTTTGAPPSEAQLQLDALVAEDKATADTLILTFVPQLATRFDGMLDDAGVTWGFPEILAEHTGFREQYGAILVDSDAYKFKLEDGQPMAGWYLTFVPEGFNTRNDANKWCRQNDLPEETCTGVEFKRPV